MCRLNMCFQLCFGLKLLIAYLTSQLIVVLAKIMDLELVLVGEAFVA